MKLLLLILAQIPLFISSQNPLKNALATVGNTQVVHYSKSAFSFSNNYSQTIFIGDVNDNRIGNWNKQLNDTIRIEPIRDYWSFPYKFLFKDKMSKDLASQKFVIGEVKDAADFTILPTVEIHFPNFVQYPSPGYWILTRVNFEIEKKGIKKLQKAYEDYYLFTKNYPEYKAEYNTNWKEGTNVAMWEGMKRVLDKFYKDLDNVLIDKEVPKDSIPLKVYSIASNIDKDQDLVKNQKSYANIDEKDKFKSSKESKNSEDEYNLASSYKMDSAKELPPPVDAKLVNAISSIPVSKEDPTASLIKKTTAAKQIAPKVDSSTKLAATNLKKAQQLKIDSVLIKKELQAKLAKEKAEKEKLIAADLAKAQKSKVDSIKTANTKLLNEKLASKQTVDSIKKLGVNKAMEIAKKKKEEERQKQELLAKAKAERMLSNKKADSIKATFKSNSNTLASTEKSAKYSKKSDEDIAAAMRRIAAEVEAEELRLNPPKPKTTSARNAAIDAANKKPTESANNSTETQKSTKSSKSHIDETIKEIATTPAIPVNFKDDSIALEIQKQKKREAIIAAQKAAFEAEKNAIANEKDADEGKLFATISKDPPSKMPDSRSFEQRKADRIFTPKNTVSRDLLNRVKLITPEEEAKLLAKLNTQDKSSVDSVFIIEQASKPIPTADIKKIDPIVPIKDTVATKPLDTATSTLKNSTKSINSKKDELISKGLQKAAELSKTPAKNLDTTKTKVSNTLSKTSTTLKSVDATKNAASQKVDTTKTIVNPASKLTKATTNTTKKEGRSKVDSTIENKAKELTEKALKKIGQ